MVGRRSLYDSGPMVDEQPDFCLTLRASRMTFRAKMDAGLPVSGETRGFPTAGSSRMPVCCNPA